MNLERYIILLSSILILAFTISSCNLLNEEKKYEIFFHKPNHGYTWEYFGEVININEIIPNSIKNKEFEEQIAYVNERDTVNVVDEERLKSHDIMPLKFKPATWYHIFGLDGIEGSYFVYINDDRTVEVKYFDGGPW